MSSDKPNISDLWESFAHKKDLKEWSVLSVIGDEILVQINGGALRHAFNAKGELETALAERQMRLVDTQESGPTLRLTLSRLGSNQDSDQAVEQGKPDDTIDDTETTTNRT